MILKEKAYRLVQEFALSDYNSNLCLEKSKKNAIFCVQNEYHSLRELLFELKSKGIEFSEKLYPALIQILIDEEKILKEEIEKIKIL